MVARAHQARAALAHIYGAGGGRRRFLARHLGELTVLAAILATIASLWVVTARHVAVERSQLEAQLMNDGADLAMALSEEASHTLNEARQATAFVVYAYQRDRSRLDLSYWSRLHAAAVFPIVSVVSPHGQVLVSNHANDVFAYAHLAFFAEQRAASGDRILIGDAALDPQSGMRYIPVSRRMTDKGGRFAGLVVVWLNPENFARAYRSASLKAGDTALIIGADDDLRMPFGKPPDSRSASISAADLQIIRQRQLPADEFIRYTPASGHTATRITAYRTMTGYPLYVVVHLNRDSAFQAFLSQRTVYYEVALAVSALILLLALALLFLLTKQRTTAEVLQETLANEALHDALTGLANRALFHDHCERALNRAHRHRHGVAVLYLDLDDFKPINDRHGHAVGDVVLQEVATRLQHCVRAVSEDLVARLGGDEFCIILSSVDRAQCEKIARKILAAIARPVTLAGLQLDLTVSIGAARFPDDTNDAETLIDLADRGMYEAKRAGKNNFRWGTAARPVVA